MNAPCGVRGQRLFRDWPSRAKASRVKGITFCALRRPERFSNFFDEAKRCRVYATPESWNGAAWQGTETPRAQPPPLSESQFWLAWVEGGGGGCGGGLEDGCMG